MTTACLHVEDPVGFLRALNSIEFVRKCPTVASFAKPVSESRKPTLQLYLRGRRKRCADGEK